MQKGVEKVLKLNPDLILFTGDLVNNKAEEMHNYMDVFNQLKAPMGVYSMSNGRALPKKSKTWNALNKYMENWAGNY